MSPPVEIPTIERPTEALAEPTPAPSADKSATTATHPREAATLDLSVVVPTMNEEKNIRDALDGVRRVANALGISYEILVVDGGSKDRTAEEARGAGARVLEQKKPGYGAALKEAFRHARGKHVLTMDSDLSHPPSVIRHLYKNRDRGELLIASRYIKGGLANMPLVRRMLSSVLNRVFSRVLAIPVSDLSSGFRLYRRDLIEGVDSAYDDFSFLQDILVRSYAAGYQVHEVPFHYFPRVHGSSKARVFKFGISYMKLLFESWRLRNSIESADYDERAYDSWILPQRWWQRKRYREILKLVDREGRIVDLGCGSSRIFEALPAAVGVDVNRKKLRYRRTLGKPLFCAAIQALPFPDGSFDQAICSQVIEHVPFDERIFKEFSRILKPGGTLILGTPDYDKWQWRFIEWVYGKVMPGGYADEHITHYTLDSLKTHLDEHGFDYLEHRYVFQGELIVKARKRI